MAQSSDVVGLYARAVDRWTAAVAGVPDGGWQRATPCTDWDVRALVNHVVGEDRWVPPLVGGKTIAEVGDALDGDLLGPAPAESAVTAGRGAVDSLAVDGALARIVHLSFGDFTAEDYAWQVLVDHVVHTWDLLAGSGGERTLDPGLVDASTGWWASWEDTYRGAGAVGPAVEVGPDAPKQDRLLGSFGRDPGWSA